MASPTLEPAEVAAWIADSVFEQPLVHTTQATNAILEEGLRVARAVDHGLIAIWFSLRPWVATSTTLPGDHLAVAVRVRAPFIVQRRLDLGPAVGLHGPSVDGGALRRRLIAARYDAVVFLDDLPMVGVLNDASVRLVVKDGRKVTHEDGWSEAEIRELRSRLAPSPVLG